MGPVNKKKLYLTIIFGCAAAFLFPGLGALYLFLALAGLVIFLIRARAPEADKKFLTVMIIAIVVTRIVLSLLVMEARGGNLFQDEGLYSKKAIIKVYEWKGVRNYEEGYYGFFDYDYDFLNPNYGYNAYTYLLSGFYYIFGYQIQAARLINGLLCILTFLLIFYMAKELFGLSAAMLYSAIFAFSPSIMLWSVSVGVDMSGILCISAYLFLLIRVLKKFNLGYLLAMAVSLLALASFRGYAVSALIAVTVIGLCCVTLKRMTKTGRIFLGLLAVLSIILIVNTPLAHVIGEGLKKNIDTVISRQGDFATADDGGYVTFPRHCYEKLDYGFTDLAQAYARGMSYVLFSPFPWDIGSKLQLMAYPQTILWYFMLPFIIYGFYLGYKKDRLVTSTMFLYCFLLFSILALVEGNMGSLFRHKDMVIPFTFMYFAAGILRAFSGKDPDNKARERFGS